MTVIFRPATRADVPAVVGLLVDDGLGSARETEDMAIYQSAFDAMDKDAGNTLIVGEQDGRIVATYQITFILGLSLKASRRAQIESVRVASDLRGQGIGHHLMVDAEMRARDAGCNLMQLTMNKSRTQTARFYAQLGFTASHIGYKRDVL
ncbi:GNAT family N-acetyltransferase [Octadecabacter sp. G9-8]|uniref:GNAT family N-acetyltransferase n=1 Tax=Octadecabacter dasysiphoniae TaxID=2909341 RepID=A0ABS9CUF7_9RHOB|nr:GNAT family N-acetyltransferase [Octadecabacter dasysiphoniae]MCF2870808.1 GNAT family N-acetyltransferase [Octadecabacter dasysiphoniae]